MIHFLYKNIFKIIKTSFTIVILFSQLCSQNSVFLNPWYWGNEDQYYILNKSIIHDNSDPNLNLFCVAYNGAIVYDDNDEVITFIVDPVWNRIVYSKYNSYWAKAFGEYGTDNLQFKHPNAVATDGLGNVYVADTHVNRIVKLQYNSTNEEIDATSFSTIGESILDNPWDLDVDDRGNFDPSDDVIWVVDNDGANCTF